jgi:hypothetical protein
MEMPLTVVVDGLRVRVGTGPGARGADVFAVISWDNDGRWAPTFDPLVEGGLGPMIEPLLRVPVFGAPSKKFSTPILLWRARLAIVSRGATFGAALLRSGFALNYE